MKSIIERFNKLEKKCISWLIKQCASLEDMCERFGSWFITKCAKIILWCNGWPDERLDRVRQTLCDYVTPSDDHIAHLSVLLATGFLYKAFMLLWWIFTS